MPTEAIVAEVECAHAHTVIALEREGEYLHQRAYVVMRCLDCLRLLDRKRVRAGQ